MPWWLLIKKTPSYFRQLFGAKVPVPPRPTPQPQPQPDSQSRPDKYYRHNYDHDKNFRTEEHLISGNRIYSRTYNTTPGEKQDTTISVRAYPYAESIGTYRSPYYDGVDNANEPMDVDSWNQVNDKIDAGKRNLILGHQFGGSLLSKQAANKIKNIFENKKYYGGELNPAVVYDNGIYGGHLPGSAVVAEEPTYYGGELDPAVVYGYEPIYYGGELPGATVYGNEPTYYGGELPAVVVYGSRPRKRDGSL